MSPSSKAPHTVVIGAGIAGLTAAALLIKVGHRVTVLEAQVYPGGSAGTYFYQGYRFDAGATLAGGFAPGGPHHQVAEQLGITWPVRPVDPIAWTVHLPDGRAVPQWTDAERWRSERADAFPTSARFWQKQELLADLSWDISTRPFPWPPADARDLATLAAAVRPRTLLATPYILRTIGSLLPDDDPWLALFVNANLLISAQVTADRANALYGSAALDLPRRGVNHVRGGIGGIAETLADWVREHGGTLLYRQRVDAIDVRNGRAVAVHTNRDKRNSHNRQTFECDNLLANLTPWGLHNLLGAASPPKLAREVAQRDATWGAFMLYLGVQADRLPADTADHHQVVADADRPLGETNSIFVSMSDPHDATRAPAGMRAVNISTHTAIAPWWALRNDPARRAEYDERRAAYTQRMIDLADRAIPGFKSAVTLTLPATPVTYEHWTGRPQGMVGGFPQTSILDARGPGTGLRNVWLVGDSVFPGQSTAGVTLSAMRVARAVARTGRPFTLRNPLTKQTPEVGQSASRS